MTASLLLHITTGLFHVPISGLCAGRTSCLRCTSGGCGWNWRGVREGSVKMDWSSSYNRGLTVIFAGRSSSKLTAFVGCQASVSSGANLADRCCPGQGNIRSIHLLFCLDHSTQIRAALYCQFHNREGLRRLS
jgi:hypothetical protein